VLGEAEAAVQAAAATPAGAGGAVAPSVPHAALRGPALAGVDLAAQRLRLGLPGHGSRASLSMGLAARVADYFACLGDSLSCAADLRRVAGRPVCPPRGPSPCPIDGLCHRAGRVLSMLGAGACAAAGCCTPWCLLEVSTHAAERRRAAGSMSRTWMRPRARGCRSGSTPRATSARRARRAAATPTPACSGAWRPSRSRRPPWPPARACIAARCRSGCRSRRRNCNACAASVAA